MYFGKPRKRKEALRGTMKDSKVIQPTPRGRGVCKAYWQSN